RTEPSDRIADLGRDALLDDDVEHAVGLRLEVERGLVGLDLGDHLTFLDGLAALLLPFDDRALLHRVGELRHVYLSHFLSREREQRGRLCRRRDEGKPPGFSSYSLPSAIERLPAHHLASQLLDVLASRHVRLFERKSV